MALSEMYDHMVRWECLPFRIPGEKRKEKQRKEKKRKEKKKESGRYCGPRPMLVGITSWLNLRQCLSSWLQKPCFFALSATVPAPMASTSGPILVPNLL